MEEIFYMLGATAAVALLGMQLFKTFIAKDPSAGEVDRVKQAAQLERLCDELRIELEVVRDEHAAAIDELYSRIDFAERLLIRGHQVEQEEERQPTPV